MVWCVQGRVWWCVVWCALGRVVYAGEGTELGYRAVEEKEQVPEHKKVVTVPKRLVVRPLHSLVRAYAVGGE